MGHNLDRLASQLKASSGQIRTAAMVGLTRTALAVRDAQYTAMKLAIDQPTPYTLNSLRVSKATPSRLEAMVWLKDDLAGSGTPATKYLLPQIEGGARRVKRFEKALQLAGHMPAGYQCVPSKSCPRDAYGNPSRGVIIQILSQLRITLTSGYIRNMALTHKGDYKKLTKQQKADNRSAIAAQRRAGGRFFVLQSRVGGKSPGIYQREFMGENVTAVFLFKRATAYKPRYDWWGVGATAARDNLDAEFERALQEKLGRDAARAA